MAWTYSNKLTPENSGIHEKALECAKYHDMKYRELLVDEYDNGVMKKKLRSPKSIKVSKKIVDSTSQKWSELFKIKPFYNYDEFREHAHMAVLGQDKRTYENGMEKIPLTAKRLWEDYGECVKIGKVLTNNNFTSISTTHYAKITVVRHSTEFVCESYNKHVKDTLDFLLTQLEENIYVNMIYIYFSTSSTSFRVVFSTEGDKTKNILKTWESHKRKYKWNKLTYEDGSETVKNGNMLRQVKAPSPHKPFINDQDKDISMCQFNYDKIYREYLEGKQDREDREDREVQEDHEDLEARERKARADKERLERIKWHKEQSEKARMEKNETNHLFQMKNYISKEGVYDSLKNYYENTYDDIFFRSGCLTKLLKGVMRYSCQHYDEILRINFDDLLIEGETYFVMLIRTIIYGDIPECREKDTFEEYIKFMICFDKFFDVENYDFFEYEKIYDLFINKDMSYILSAESKHNFCIEDDLIYFQTKCEKVKKDEKEKKDEKDDSAKVITIENEEALEPPKFDEDSTSKKCDMSVNTDTIKYKEESSGKEKKDPLLLYKNMGENKVTFEVIKVGGEAKIITNLSSENTTRNGVEIEKTPAFMFEFECEESEEDFKCKR